MHPVPISVRIEGGLRLKRGETFSVRVQKAVAPGSRPGQSQGGQLCRQLFAQALPFRQTLQHSVRGMQPVSAWASRTGRNGATSVQFASAPRSASRAVPSAGAGLAPSQRAAAAANSAICADIRR